MIGQLFRAIPPLLELGQNELGPGGHHEVLLVDPQEASGLVAVVGVEEAGQAAADVGLVKVDARLRRGGRVLHVEEVQAVGDAAVGPRHGDVPEHGGEVELAEGHGEALLRGDAPAGVLQPGVGDFRLLVVRQLLPEEAIVVAEPHAVPRQAQGGDGVQEAGGKAAQPAVAQAGLGLQLLDGGQVPPQLRQEGADLLPDAQGQQVVAQQLPHQELGGEVVELPVPLGGASLLGEAVRQLQQGPAELLVIAVLRRGPEAGAGDLLKLFFQLHVSMYSFQMVGQRLWICTICRFGIVSNPDSFVEKYDIIFSRRCKGGWAGQRGFRRNAKNRRAEIVGYAQSIGADVSAPTGA